MLEHCQHDFYHLPSYNDFAAKLEGGRSLAFYAEENGSKLLIPLILRKLPSEFKEYGEYFDCTTPYGYSCPLLSPQNDYRLLPEFLQAFKELAKEKNLVTAFIRLNPFLEFPMDILENFAHVYQHGEIVYIDLSRPMEEIWKNTRKNHRVGIKKLTKEGFQTIINDWDYYNEFTKIYISTMKRVHAEEYYFFSEDYFYELREILGNILNLGIALAPSGEVAAGGLFTSLNGFTQCHLTATAENFFEKAPCKLIFNAIRIWSKDHDNKIINMGGGVGCKQDSLFHYKIGFSKLTKPFYCLGMIFNQEVYEDLINISQNNKDNEFECCFFPLYRMHVCQTS
jgi:hypothetical protein